MFEKHFQLERMPFSREVPISSLYLSKSHQEALSRLRYTAERRQVMLLTGDPGVGKSTILRKLKNDLDPGHFEVIYLNQTGATERSFFMELLSGLRLEMPFGLVKAKVIAAKALLERYQTHHRTPVLLLDEGQEMPDVLLKTLPGLLNYECDAFSPFAMVLIGNRKLDHRLRLQNHEALWGRIQMHFHLNSLTQEESMTYVQHSLEAAGATRAIFTEPALRKLHQSGNGNPRLINKVASLCMMAAHSNNQDLIDDELVAQVVACEMEGNS